MASAAGGAPIPGPVQPAPPVVASSGPRERHDGGHDGDGARRSFLAGLAGALIGALAVVGAFAVLDDESSPDPQPNAGEVFVRPAQRIARAGDLAEILRKDVPAVVAIVADGGPDAGGGAGTGFVISPSGVIVTNNHVVEGASRIEAHFSDGESLEAIVLGTDPASDLAVLEVDGTDLPTIVLGNSDRVQVGDDVVAIGNALALEGGLSVTRGIVSGLDRTVPTSRSTVLSKVIQTDAAINPGNSGGPLVDSRGRVIGINTAIADPASSQNVGFAIPISQARATIDALANGDRPAFLGVSIDVEDDASGARVVGVTPGAPAAEGGLEVGDLIVGIGGSTVGSWEELRPAIRRNRPGDAVDVVVERGGERVTLRVTLEEDPGSS